MNMTVRSYGNFSGQVNMNQDGHQSNDKYDIQNANFYGPTNVRQYPTGGQHLFTTAYNSGGHGPGGGGYEAFPIRGRGARESVRSGCGRGRGPNLRFNAGLSSQGNLHVASNSGSGCGVDRAFAYSMI